MSQTRGRDSFFRVAACAAAAILLAARAGCQESAAPAAAQPSFAQGRSTANAPVKTPVSSRPQPIHDISFDNVKLDLKKGDPFKRSLITPAIQKLDGNRIRIRGYILPPPQQSGLTRFVVVRDNKACCFGPGAAIFDSMIVDMQPGQTTDYSLSPVTIEGTFNIREIAGPDGNALAIYHLTAESVK